jgi:predicted nucleic acid-binding protein
MGCGAALALSDLPMLKSLDTNILVYAHNADAPEFPRAAAVIAHLARSPSEWLLADQVLWELYAALRNPTLLRKPLNAREAMARVRTLRENSRVAFCAYETRLYSQVAAQLERSDTPYRRTYDIVLAITLTSNGVSEFYTRNPKDFGGLGFKRVIDPIAI